MPLPRDGFDENELAPWEASDSWEDPMPLDHPPVRPFPLEVLPNWLRAFVAELSIGTQTPTDLAGVMALAVIAGCAGGRIWVEGKWREPLNLYTATFLPSGERKTAVIEELTAPLYELERAQAEELRETIVQLDTKKRIAQTAADNAQREAAKQVDPVERLAAEARAIEEAQRAAEIQVPAWPRRVVGDITPEELVGKMAEQRGRLALFADEGGVFGAMLGRYERSGRGVSVSLDTWLRAHTGVDIRVDRKGREGDFVSHACLTIGLSVQPGLLQEISRSPELKERGLLGRFLYAIPVSLMGVRNVDAPAMQDSTRSVYAGKVIELARALDGRDEDTTLFLHPDAVSALTEFSREIEPRLSQSGDLRAMSSWAGKLAGAVLRLSGLLHLAKHGAAGDRFPVDGETMGRALILGRYFLSHARVVFDTMEADESLSQARETLEFLTGWLVREDRERFTARDYAAARGAKWRKPGIAEEVLDRLTDYGWLRRIDPERHTGPGRKPKATFQPHPQLLATKVSKYTKPDESGSFAHYVGFVARNGNAPLPAESSGAAR